MPLTPIEFVAFLIYDLLPENKIDLHFKGHPFFFTVISGGERFCILQSKIPCLFNSLGVRRTPFLRRNPIIDTMPLY